MDVDSGTSNHRTSDKSSFTSLQNAKNSVYMADNLEVPVKGIGDRWLYCITPEDTVEKIHIKDVLYVPSLDGGLLSVPRITRGGYKVVFEGKTCSICQKNSAIAQADLEGTLIILKCTSNAESVLMVKSGEDRVH